MRRSKQLTLVALFTALAVVGSLFAVPVFGSKCAPVQHMVNIFCAVFLGPFWAIASAFVASIIRNLLGLGTLLAFPGSMCGALLSGLLYKHFGRLWFAYIGEALGTSVIGGILAYPVAYFILGNKAAAIFMFVIPFLISTAVGSLLAAFIITAMDKSGTLSYLKNMIK